MEGNIQYMYKKNKKTPQKHITKLLKHTKIEMKPEHIKLKANYNINKYYN